MIYMARKTNPNPTCKVVLHMKYMVNVKQSVGIECVFSRDQVILTLNPKL